MSEEQEGKDVTEEFEPIEPEIVSPSTALRPIGDRSVLAPDIPDGTFGEYVRKSRVCPVCMRSDHMEINYMRAQHHMTYREIAVNKTLPESALDTHFRNHFIISKHHQDIIDLQENSSQESNEIIARILSGEVDLFGGAQGVLKSKVQRLHEINAQRKELADRQEVGNLEVEDQQRYLLLNKLAEDVENSIMKVHQILDKKYFPTNEEELKRKLLSFKYSVLKNFVDEVILVLIEFEKNPEYRDLVRQIRLALSPRISLIEEKIMKSGGAIQEIDNDAGIK